MQKEIPALNSLFFAVCRTAIRNVSWKYSEFERVKQVEGQLDALEDYFKQPVKPDEIDEGVSIDLEPESDTPQKSIVAGQGEATAPQVVSASIPEANASPKPVQSQIQEGEQEKKN